MIQTALICTKSHCTKSVFLQQLIWNTLFFLATIHRRWYKSYLHDYTSFSLFWATFGSSNFKRDIVDRVCHASRVLDTIRPNKVHFLLCRKVLVQYIPTQVLVGIAIEHFILSTVCWTISVLIYQRLNWKHIFHFAVLTLTWKE